MKLSEWSTVLYPAIPGSVATWLFATHWSDYTVVPLSASRVASRVVAFLWETSSMYSGAGVWDVSTVPNTHCSLAGWCPQWYWCASSEKAFLVTSFVANLYCYPMYPGIMYLLHWYTLTYNWSPAKLYITSGPPFSSRFMAAWKKTNTYLNCIANCILTYRQF